MTTTLVDRLLGRTKKGPAVFSEEELRQIQAAFLGITKRNQELTRMVEHTWDALRWNKLYGCSRQARRWRHGLRLGERAERR